MGNILTEVKQAQQAENAKESDSKILLGRLNEHTGKINELKDLDNVLKELMERYKRKFSVQNSSNKSDKAKLKE